MLAKKKTGLISCRRPTDNGNFSELLGCVVMVVFLTASGRIRRSYRVHIHELRRFLPGPSRDVL